MIHGLGIDLGTTYTAAAVSDPSGTRAIPLGEKTTVSSVVVAAENGDLLTGDAAEAAAIEHPQRASHNHKRRLGDPDSLVLGDVVRSPASVMAAQLRDTLAVVAKTTGADPGAVVLTCPAVWGPYRREHFAEVPRLAGIRDATIITEPEAAAIHYSNERRLGDGSVIAVYDLGGGTFDATVLRARRGRVEILGGPEGVEQLGGLDFDNALLAHLDGRVDGAISALDPDDPEHALLRAGVLTACRQAKETLSTEPDIVIGLPLPGRTHEIPVTRVELNALIRPHVDVTTEALSRTIASAGLRPEELMAIVLAGGSSHIPLVRQILTQSFGIPVHVSLHPKLAVALGAATVARSKLTSRPAPHQPAPAPPPSQPQNRPAIPNHTLTSTPITAPSSTQEVVPPIVFAPGPPPVAHGAQRAGRRFTVRKPLLIAGAVAAVLVLVGGVLTMTLMNSASDGKHNLTASTGSPSTTPSPAPPSTSRANNGPVFFANGQESEGFTSLIGSPEDWGGSQVSADGRATRPSISVTPADVNGGGDGRRITWSGSSVAQFYVQNTTRTLDARPYVSTGTLAFDTIVQERPAGDVTLAIHCTYPCAGQVNATSVFRDLPIGQKSTVRIPLSCFTSKGLDPAKVNTAFLISTDRTFTVSFAGIRWENDTASDAGTTPCSKFP